MVYANCFECQDFHLACLGNFKKTGVRIACKKKQCGYFFLLRPSAELPRIKYPLLACWKEKLSFLKQFDPTGSSQRNFIHGRCYSRGPLASIEYRSLGIFAVDRSSY